MNQNISLKLYCNSMYVAGKKMLIELYFLQNYNFIEPLKYPR